MDERFTYLVEKYLENELNAEEQDEFGKYLSDPGCAEYLKRAAEIEELMAAGIRRFAVKDSDKKKQAPEQGDGNEEMYGSGGSDDHSETREMLRRVHRQMITRKRRVRIYSYSGIAAAVLTGLFLFFQLRPGPDPQSLYDTYYKTWQFEVRRSVESNPGLYSRAKSAYMAGDYSGSAEMCRTMLVTRPPEPEIHLLLGLNLMDLDSIQGAIQQFKAAATFPMDKQGIFYAPVHWYQALSYLKAGNKDSARIALKAILNEDCIVFGGIDAEGLEEEIGE